MNPEITSPLEEQARQLEPIYRSAGETRIGRLLDRYEMPFFYQQPTLIYDQGKYEIWQPAFTLPAANGGVIDYFGRIDAYQEQAMRHKENIYRDNGVHALVVTPPDLEGDQWAERLYARIEEVARYAGANRPGYSQRSVDAYHH